MCFFASCGLVSDCLDLYTIAKLSIFVLMENLEKEASVALEPDSGRDPAGSSEESKNTESAGEQSSSGPDAQQTAAEQCQTLTQEQREFFSSEKGKRDELQEKTMEDLTELAGAADGSESARLEAVKAAQKLADTIKMQGDIEAEVKTKGFCECIASINNSCCTVIVTKDELNDATAVTIKDIVNRQSGIGFENITITSF